MAAVAVLLVAYLLGSVDFGVLVPRTLGVDIYRVGSGNPGASNVFRTLGKGPAALVLLGDSLKGVVAALLGGAVGGDALGFAAGLAAVVGHSFPLWHRFRGGRGVATALGVAVALEPLVGLVLVALWLLVVLVGKVASVASLLVMALYLPGLAVAGQSLPALGWAAGIAVLVVVRHAPNIRRLLGGGERKVVSG